MLACFSGQVIHHSLFYYLKDDGNRRFLMIIKHILMLFNHEFFNMIMYQYVILPDVLLNYRLLL
ncbi:hypothetical protein DMI60_13855 [Escherichia coli]|nr:hypothetical protein [Escherichia coli]